MMSLFLSRIKTVLGVQELMRLAVLSTSQLTQNGEVRLNETDCCNVRGTFLFGMIVFSNSAYAHTLPLGAPQGIRKISLPSLTHSR